MPSGRCSADARAQRQILPSVKKMREHEVNRHTLSLAETERIIGAMPHPYDVFTRLVAYTGMRPEEATALTLDDVDLDEGTVRVRSVLIEGTGDAVREHFAKSDAGKRTIDLDTRTLDALAEYVAAHRRRAARWFSDHPDCRHFGAEDGDALPLFVGLRYGGRTTDPMLDRYSHNKKADRAARRRELDAAYAEDLAREAGADNVTPLTPRSRAT